MDYSICLNMIVKNESHVIRNTLENLCKYIPFSYYVISDTGSTDNTKEIIADFFNKKNIPGEIHDDEWKDFGHNRTMALKHAYKKTKYLFIFDADDTIFGDFVLPKILDKDSYYFKFGCGVVYKRLLLINNHLDWLYVGVLHEFIICTNPNISNDFLDGNYFVDSGKTGDRSNDPDKYKKDAMILEKAFYEAEKRNDDIKIRYSFYTAQSYRDSNQKEKAIEWYKKRIELKSWNQEVYFSYYMIGKLYNELDQFEKAIHYWTLGYESDTDRYESHYEIISNLRKKNNMLLAYQYYLMINRKNIDVTDKLFLYSPIYEYLLDYEMTIIFFYNNKFKEGIETYKKLFIQNNISFDTKFNLLENFNYYLDNINLDLDLFEKYFNFIKTIPYHFFNTNHIQIINIAIDKFTSFYNNPSCEIIKNTLNKNTVFFSITSCKRFDLFLKTMNSFLTCCKDIHLITEFFCIDDNSSEEDRIKMKDTFPFFDFYFKNEDEKGHLKSMNIIWEKLNTLKPKYWLHIEDDWLFIKPFNMISKSIEFLEKYSNDEHNIHQLLFNKNYGEVFDNINFVGGRVIDNDFLLHIKDEEGLNGRNCSYWPHYSFRPSICSVDKIIELGNFNSVNTFFERDYADKYFKKGYKSAFYNEITSIHIGRLTSERNDFHKKNAYELNNIHQFENIHSYENNLNIVELKDNRLLKEGIIQEYVKKLFINNKFGSIKKYVYPLLSYYDAMKDAMKKSNNYFAFFHSKLYHKSIENKNENNDLIKKIIEDDNIDLLFLKDGSYIIHQNNLNIIIEYIDNNGFSKSTFRELLNDIGITYKDIDFFNDIIGNNIIGNDIIRNDIIENDINNLDKNNDSFDFEYSILNDSNYVFIKNMDHFGDDLFHNNNVNLINQMYLSDKDDNIIAFNTLGYFKNHVNTNNLIQLKYNENDGIYINIDRYNKKYKDNGMTISKKNLITFNNKSIENDDKNDKDNNNTRSNSVIDETFVAKCSNKNSVINFNISNLKDDDNHYSLINFKKYIKQNYTDFEVKESFIKIIDNYLFIKNYDFIDHEIYNNLDFNINEMIKFANEKDDIVAFNTIGSFSFKSKINLDNIIFKEDMSKDGMGGIFIKISAIKNQIFKVEDVNVIDKNFYCDVYNNNNGILTILDENNDYIAYHSTGFLKKTINFNNYEIEENKYSETLNINVFKLFEKMKINYQNNGKKRVKIICNWTSSEKLLKIINRFSMGKCMWNNLEFTCDDHFIDYYVLMDGQPINKNIYYNKEKTLFLNDNLKYYLWRINFNYFELKYNIIEKEYNKVYKNNIFHLKDILKYKYLVVSDENCLIEGILAECLCIYSGESEKISNNVYIRELDWNENKIEECLWEEYIDIIRKEKNRIIEEYNICSLISKMISEK